MQFLKRIDKNIIWVLRAKTMFLLIFLPAALGAAGRVRDVNTQRNQVTVTTNKAGEFAMGSTVYFYRSGKSTGSAQITQAFHTKAIGRIAAGSPQIGDDATPTAKAPKAAPKVTRVVFGANAVQAHEFMTEVEFEGQEKQQRKIKINSEVAAQIQGAQGYIGITATLLKKLDVVWENGALRVNKVLLSDKSSFDLTVLVATDLFARIKPAAETRGQTVKGKITFLKKMRDLPDLTDGITVDLKVAAGTARMKPGAAYKLKIYCNDLFAGEFFLKASGQEITDHMMLNPIDLAPVENTLEMRLVEVTEQGELFLETDNNQLVGTLLVSQTTHDLNPKVIVSLTAGQDTSVNQVKNP